MSFVQFRYRTREETSRDGELLEDAAIRPGLGSPRTRGDIDEGECVEYERIICQRSMEFLYQQRLRTLLMDALRELDEDWLTFSFRSLSDGTQSAWINGPSCGDQYIPIVKLQRLLGDRLFRCIDRSGVHLVMTDTIYRHPVIGLTEGKTHYEPRINPGNAVLYAHDWIGLIESASAKEFVVRMFTRAGTDLMTRIARQDASRYLRELTDSRLPSGILHFPFRFPRDEPMWAELNRIVGHAKCETPDDLIGMLQRAFAPHAPTDDSAPTRTS